MTFQSVLVAGLTLIRQAIQSQNYSPGSAGWAIRADGTAEFNSATIRKGTIVSGTSLYYSGTPALGNLIASISDSDGTDAYGNHYYTGFCTYYPGSVTVKQAAGNISFQQSTAAGTVPAIINGSEGSMRIYSGYPAGGSYDESEVLLINGTANTGKPGGAGPAVTLLGGNSAVTLNVTGAVQFNDVLGGVVGWQTPSYTASWAGGTALAGTSGFPPLRYRKDGEDNLWLYGCFTVTAAGAGATVFTLPSGYYNTSGLQPFDITERQATGTFQDGIAYVGTTGNVHVDLSDNFTRNTGDVFMVNAKVPLGNLP